MQKIFTGIYRSVMVVIIFQVICFTGFTQIDENHGKIRTIVIDPGHGGKDSGALGKHSKEKDIVLAISLKAGKYIEENIPDVEVIYTRTSDVFPALHERADVANEANADLFISIHANANPNPKAYGSETYALGLHKTDENLEVAKKENSVIVFEENYESKYEGFDPNDVQSYIMMSVMTDIYLDQSLHAASLVQDQFRDRVKRKDRGVKQAGFLVLWQTSMPSILIEVGFISNPNEEKYLMSEQGQDYLASAIFRAFRDYKNYIENGSVAPEPTETISSTILAESNSNKETVAETNKPYQAQNAVTSDNPEIKATTITPTDGDSPAAVKYKVQILYSATQVDLKDDTFKDFNDIEEIKVNGKYKYVVGEKDSYNEAVEYSKWVRSRHPDAFIVAVLEGKIIPLSEAKKLENTNTN